MSTDFSQNLPRRPYALPQTAASLAEQMDIARQVRTAAQVAAKYNIADAALDRIVSLATDDFALGAPSRSMADRISLAVSLAEATNNSRAPFNWLSATPQQIEAARLAGTLPLHGGLHGLTHVASADGKGGASGGSGTIAATSGGNVSAAAMARYSREYAGMGFDPTTIGTFAHVGLGINDYRSLEKRWGREEVVKGAGTADEFGLRGKRGVKAATGMSDEEHKLWIEWGNEKDPVKKEAIRKRINVLPHRGKTKPEWEEDHNYIQKHLRLSSEAQLQRNASTAAPASSGAYARKADSEAPVRLVQAEQKLENKTSGSLDALEALEASAKLNGAPTSPGRQTAAVSPQAQQGKPGGQPQAPQQHNAEVKPTQQPDKPGERTRIGLATQAKPAGPSVA
jgi:hypothetical protein